MDAATTQPARRRRRSPEEAEREIIAAAHALLQERPFRELTVDEVMRRTGLSRPSFYVYFRDRHHLILRLVEQIGNQLYDMSNRWFRGTEDGPGQLRAAVEGVVRVWLEHGPVMRALADAAADDPGVEDVYRDHIEGFVTATCEHLKREKAAGRIDGVDPAATAVALVWMNERYLYRMVSDPESRERAIETLSTIWIRTIYPGA